MGRGGKEGSNCGAAARAALFDNFFMQRFLLAFLFSSLSLSLLQSFAYFLSLLQVQRSEFPFLSFPFWSSSWRNQTHYVQSVEALSMILLYSTPPTSLLLLLLSLAFRFLRICQLGVMKDIERALGIRLARDVDL